MENRFRNIWKFLLLALPLILGTAGFLLAGESVLDAMFISACLYGMEYQDPPVNLLVEIARWTAPLATAGGVLMLFSSVRRAADNFLRYLGGDSVAVYGPEDEKEPILDQLGRRGIDGGERFVRAHRYILLGNEEDNLAFYSQNQRALAGHVTCLKCSSLRAQESVSPDVRILCPEETAARLFWKERCLYETSVRHGHNLKIVFLGFGKLGEELLLRGLQDNIFDPGQRIEYHIFGEAGAFSAVRHQISMISDPVVFHKEPWHDQLSLLEEAQVVAVLTQEGQLALVQDLLLALCPRELHVFASNDGNLEFLSGRDRLQPFYWERESGRLENIWGDKLFDRAKRINLRYAVLYGGASDTEEAREEEWKKLDAFTRYSNISAADYHEIQLQMLEAMGESADPERLSPDRLELLSELEHIRWCRYHYLNNWQYGIPENGKSKDPARRLHRDLVPYGQLTEEEKEKDRENIRILLSVK